MAESGKRQPPFPSGEAYFPSSLLCNQKEGGAMSALRFLFLTGLIIWDLVLALSYKHPEPSRENGCGGKAP